MLGKISARDKLLTEKNIHKLQYISDNRASYTSMKIDPGLPLVKLFTLLYTVSKSGTQSTRASFVFIVSYLCFVPPTTLFWMETLHLHIHRDTVWNNPLY